MGTGGNPCGGLFVLGSIISFRFIASFSFPRFRSWLLETNHDAPVPHTSILLFVSFFLFDLLIHFYHRPSFAKAADSHCLSIF
jgi:hypothetical protein